LTLDTPLLVEPDSETSHSADVDESKVDSRTQGGTAWLRQCLLARPVSDAVAAQLTEAALSSRASAMSTAGEVKKPSVKDSKVGGAGAAASSQQQAIRDQDSTGAGVQALEQLYINLDTDINQQGLNNPSPGAVTGGSAVSRALWCEWVGCGAIVSADGMTDGFT